MIDKYIIFITFLPWIAIFIINVIRHLNDKNYRTFSLKYFKKNFFQLFRLDTLLLIFVFYYFSSFDKEFVDQYLFAVMCLYLCVNSFYDKKEKIKKNFFKNNILEIILLFIIMLVPFLIYFNQHDLVFTYKMMLIYLFVQYFFILGVCYLTKGIKKLFKGTI